MLFSLRSPRNRAHRGHRAGFVEVGSGGDQGQHIEVSAGHAHQLQGLGLGRTLQKIVGGIVGRRLELGANTYRVLVLPTSTERTPTPPDTSRNRPAGAPLRPPVIDGIEERNFLASMRFHPIGGGPKTTKTDKKHSSRQESHPLLDRPAIERPCRTRISCHHLVWAAH